MGLETATYLSGLNSSNPDGADVRSQGDDHLRLIKATLLATLPNASKPFRLPVTVALQTANFTVDSTTGDNTVYPVDATAGSVTVTLPASPAYDAFTVRVVKWDSSANTVVVDGGPNDLGIDNTVTIYSQDQALDFVWSSTLTKWIVLGPIGSILTSSSSPDLAAIEALSTTGILKRTGSNTWALTAGVADLAATTANRLFGTNGSGVSGLVTLTAPLALAGGALSVDAATTSTVGVIRQADAAAMAAGTANRAVTADVQRYHILHPKVSASIQQSGTQAILNTSSGASSVSDLGVGNSRITFTEAFANTTYQYYFGGKDDGVNGDVIIGVGSGDTKSTTQLGFHSVNFSATAIDYPEANVLIVGAT